jgi:dipeptidyl-peptidase-4
MYSKSDRRWVDLVPGVPAWSKDECIVDTPDAKTRRLYVAGKPVSKRELQVRKLVGEAASGGFTYLASGDPRETHVWISYPDRTHMRLSEGPGVFDAEVGGNTVVIFGPSLGDRPLKAEILTLADPSRRVALRSVSAKVAIRPRPHFLQTRVRNINYAILYPKNFRRDRKLPVLMDPYAGPAAQRCVKSSLAFTVSQWFADQGFAVIVADGRGTPGRGKAWEQAIAGDLIGPALADQIAVLDHAITTGASVDSTRVGIRGWSYGGYLAAMAVLLRPDRFHAAIAGAPVTDWRFYDTHYTERYLGDPKRNGKAYDSCSAVLAAPHLAQPLLLIHGLSDDNVFAAHTLRLSRALFQAGRQHNVLPLTGITHMAASEVAAEMLLRAQLRFLREALKVG